MPVKADKKKPIEIIRLACLWRIAVFTGCLSDAITVEFQAHRYPPLAVPVDLQVHHLHPALVAAAAVHQCPLLHLAAVGLLRALNPLRALQSAEGSSPNADSASTDSGGAGEPPETIEQLDDALDSSLEEFDDAVAGNGNNDKPAPIDILSPSGSSGGVDSDEPLFEEADEGSADRSASIEERAAEGAPPNAEGSEGSGAEGAASQSASAQEGDGEINSHSRGY